MDKTELYTIHLFFADGSNPYVRYNISQEELQAERSKWVKEYDLRLDRYVKGIGGGGIYFYIAMEKGANHNGNQGSAF